MASGYVVAASDSAFTVQCRVLHALVLRELKSRYGDRRLGFMWALIEPIVFVTVFVLVFQFIGRGSQNGIPMPLFFVAAISPFFMFRDIFSQVAQGTRGHQSLLMFPQVTRLDLVIAKLFFNALVSIAVYFILILGLYFLGYPVHVEDPLGVMIGFACLILLGFGLGLVLGAVSIRYEFVQSFSQPLLGRPLFLTSGLFFSASMLPPAAREIALYNPVLHCIELIRASMFESFTSRYIDLGYVSTFILILISFGLMLLGVFERQRK